MTIDNIIEEIDKAKSIVILTHEMPDGDAIGSSLALYTGLKQLGKEADVIIPEYSKTFEFLPNSKEIKKEGKTESYDLAIALDCGDIKRLNGFAGYFENANTTISIDHHSSNTMFADYNYVDPVAPACAQILVKVLPYWNIEITKEIGTCLLTGIITDTGGFKYSGVTAETFEFAAELIRKGAKIKEYNKNIEIKGLHLECNLVESDDYGVDSRIVGLRAQVAFIYVENLKITDFWCHGLLEKDYAIQVSAFKNIYLDNLFITGDKDGVHLGWGSDFVIKNGKFWRNQPIW